MRGVVLDEPPSILPEFDLLKPEQEEPDASTPAGPSRIKGTDHRVTGAANDLRRASSLLDG